MSRWLARRRRGRHDLPHDDIHLGRAVLVLTPVVVGHRRRQPHPPTVANGDAGTLPGHRAGDPRRPATAVARRRHRGGRSPRPGEPSGMRAASREPSSSIDSASDTTRRQTHRLVLVRMAWVITPFGLWVASSRCTPRLRPCVATVSSRSFTSGWRSTSRRELVDHHEQVGKPLTADSGSRSCSTMLATPAVRGSACAASISASSAVKARAASDMSPSRSVTIPTTCGSGGQRPRTWRRPCSR